MPLHLKDCMDSPQHSASLPLKQRRRDCWPKIVPGVNRVAALWPIATAMLMCDMHVGTITLPAPAWLQYMRLGHSTCAQ